MKLYLNHTERYPVEQLQMQLFAAEPSEFVTAPFAKGENGAVSSLFTGKKYVTATAKITWNGKTGSAAKRLLREQADVRHTRRILQQSYYLAAMQVLDTVPPWGALSGVRPSKLSTKALLAGKTRRQAERELEREFFVTPERAKLCVDASEHTVEAIGLLAPRDLSVYIGIPFCPTRCAYCSFVSVDAPKLLKSIPDYLNALEQEMRSTAAAVKAAGRRIVAVYVGGGTPTTLSAPELDRLLADTKACFDLSACREFTVEAGRPDTVTEEKLAVLVSHGVNRVSVNPQTMSDAVLEEIGRHHTAAQVREAVAMVKKFPQLAFNMDLIAGLPGDTPESFSDTVREVIALGAENITVHTLALKKGSRFLTEGTALPDGKAVGEMLGDAREKLEAAGYAPYYLYRQKFMSGSFENVGWTKPGYENLYNICIMEELCGILAVGAGGSTKLTAPGGVVKRLMAPKYPREYMDRIAHTCAEKDEIVRFYNSEPKGTN